MITVINLSKICLRAALASVLVLVPIIATNEVLKTNQNQMPAAVDSSLIDLPKSALIDVPKTESIINGVDTGGPVFYQVGISYASTGQIIVCGGVMISPRLVLTAAHCINSQQLPRVHINQYAQNDPTGSVQIYINSFEDVVVHEDYESLGLKNDIALIILPFALDVGGADRKYPQINESPYIPTAGDSMELTGWGETETGSLSNVLQRTTLDYVPLDQCRKIRGGVDDFEITDKMICAMRNATQACIGDSGGPLVLSSGGSDDDVVLVGLVSWGPTSCTSDFPSGYTRVSAYANWIKNNACSRTGEFCQHSKARKSAKTFSHSYSYSMR